jgi:two-component system sensor histidine kinase AauS
VDAALMLLQPRLQHSPAQIEHAYASDARLGIDQTRLEQILVNLIGTALDAMDDQDDRRLCLSGAADGTSYRLEVRDNGPGIAPELRGHLFEPFFTTKPGEQGLGLGLTLSASLAAAAGGHLGVHHPQSGGTAFILSLALLASAPVETDQDG